MLKRWFRTDIYLASGYMVSVMLIVVYVNMFPLWKLLSIRLELETLAFLPIAFCIGGITIASTIFFIPQRRAGISVSKRYLSIGIIFCALALIIPDPQFPVKRIHVAEYALLSLVVRFAMSFRLQGVHLLFFSACFASVLGVHDELLQGFHPSRTYGLRDMAVNTLSSFGGALIWHALRLFSRNLPFSGQEAETGKSSNLLYVTWLLLSILAFILPLVMYRGSDLPSWPAMPLIGTIVYFSLYRDQVTMFWKHGTEAITAVSFALILYPVISNVKELLFY